MSSSCSASRIEVGRIGKLSLADKPQVVSKKNKRRGKKVTTSKSSSAAGPSSGAKAEESKIATSLIPAILAFFDDLAGGKSHKVMVCDTAWTGDIPEHLLNAPRVYWFEEQTYVPFEVFYAQHPVKKRDFKLHPQSSCS